MSIKKEYIYRYFKLFKTKEKLDLLIINKFLMKKEYNKILFYSSLELIRL